ncbi:hypothetical protein D3C86_1013810 [compost metagenome]
MQEKWFSTAPDDLGSSPWGGLSGKPGSWPDPKAEKGIISAPNWPATPWTIDASRDIALQGFTGYGLNTPGASQSATDVYSGTTKVYHQYVVGVWNSHGEGPFFPTGH